MIKDFGIIIACCDQDFMFAKACCASIKDNLGDIEICLIIDGNFSTIDLEKAYNVHIINRKNISSSVLRKRSFGFGLTKMIAFWESPWKNFLYVDADTNIFGNILEFADFVNFDIIIDRPHYHRTDSDINTYFFNTSGIEKYFPDFDWQEHRGDYFCTGVFFGKRDIFSLEEYIGFLDLMDRNPQLFLMGEQGLVNFMICRAADRGEIRLSQQSIQLLVPDFDQEVLAQRFPLEHKNLDPQERGTVIHWCGPKKPVSGISDVYKEPMTFYRRKSIRDIYGHSGFTAEVILKIEDFQYHLYLYKNKFRRKINKVKILLKKSISG